MTLRYRGREMAHQEFGHRLIGACGGPRSVRGVEQYPKMEGRQLIMVLAPKKVRQEEAGRIRASAAPEARDGDRDEELTRAPRTGGAPQQALPRF